MSEPQTFTADVLVLGAGMAGLTAARAVAERGRDVLVLEGRDRVGGRIFSHNAEHGPTVELGAEFVHGREPELWKLIHECGAETSERSGSMLRELPDGKLIEDEDSDDGDLLSPLEALGSLQKDVPFSEWLRASDVPEEQRPALLGYVEGFNAADASRISAQALGVQQRAEDEIEGDRTWHVRGGYTKLAEHLANRIRQLGSEIRLNSIVQAVRWTPGDVQVQTNSGAFRAPQCIITLPLGVLQADTVAFEPEPLALAAARRLAMGHAARFTMLFRERWWEHSRDLYPDALHDLSFLFTPRRMPRVWWTAHPEPQQIATVTGWAGGPAAAELAGRSAEDLAREACRTLAEVFSLPESRVSEALLGAYVHDWDADPFSRGAYSYVPAGALNEVTIMSQAQSGTLFFAGEHTDTSGYWGTVHAALCSGLRAASQLTGEHATR